MDKKAVGFTPRFSQPAKFSDLPICKKVFNLLQPWTGEMELYLQRKIDEAPNMIKSSLANLVNKDDWLPSLVFLAICKPQGEFAEEVCHLAASLELLALALQLHCDSERGANGVSSPADLLAGDYLFSQALIMAADRPVFIRGMSVIISSVATIGVNKPCPNSNWSTWKCYLLQRIAGYQASLIALSSSLGAWYKGCSAREAEIYTSFGYSLGMALYINREYLLAERQLTSAVPQLGMSLLLACLLEKSPCRTGLEQIFYRGQCTPCQQKILVSEWQRINPVADINMFSYSYYQKSKTALGRLTENPRHELLNLFLKLCNI